MRSAPAVVLLALLLTACTSGTSGTSGTSQPERPGPTVDEAALASGLAALYAGDNADAEDEREGTCFAEELLAGTTPAALREGGLLDASYAVVEEVPPLPAELAGVFADAQLACTDFIEDSAAAQSAISKGQADDRAYAACLRERLDQEAVRAGLVASLQAAWDDPALQRLSRAQQACVRAG
jgi:hypothetical protein